MELLHPQTLMQGESLSADRTGVGSFIEAALVAAGEGLLTQGTEMFE